MRRPRRSRAPAPASSRPAITETTGEVASSVPIATSRSETPCDSAQAVSCSTVSRWASSMRRPCRRVPGSGGLRSRDLAGEQAGGEREEGDEAETEPPAGRYQLLLRPTREQRVLALLGDVGGRAERPRALERLGPVVGGAVRPDLALGDELLERADRLLERRSGVLLVVLVEVDDVGLQPVQ